MKKKLEKYALDCAALVDEFTLKRLGGIFQYKGDDGYYTTDTHRVMRSDEPLSGLTVKEPGEKNLGKSFDRMFAATGSADLNYELYKLPTVDEMKAGIRDLVGRKLDRVAWSDGYITMNARWLYKAMEALNANHCYVSRTKPRTQPIFLYEDDNPWSINAACILPISNNGNVGFWVAV